VEVLLRRWIVRNCERVLISEVDARTVPGASRDSCLICESEGSIRRIWSFPDDWQQMGDATLLALFDAPYRRGDAPATHGEQRRPAEVAAAER